VVTYESISRWVLTFGPHRVIEGADHGLCEELWWQAFMRLMVNWATEMVLGARERAEAPTWWSSPGRKAQRCLGMALAGATMAGTAHSATGQRQATSLVSTRIAH